MLTLCPSCHARVKLPDENDGARVRCSECGRVYLARSNGGRIRRGLRFWIGIGLGILTLTALLLRLSSERAPRTAGAASAPAGDRAPSSSAESGAADGTAGSADHEPAGHAPQPHANEQ